MNLTDVVTKFAQENGIVAGVCDAMPLDATYLKASAFTPFVQKDIEKRVNPAAIMPGVKSVVVVGVVDNGDDSYALQGTRNHPPDDATAGLSSLGTTPDYHPRVKAVLESLAATISAHTSHTYKILVDSPTLDERAFAQRAGIGFFGCHGLIISPKFGTRFNIGLLLTSAVLPQNRPFVLLACPSDCSRCITACPTSALSKGRPLDTARCLSYLTQKKILTAEEEMMVSHGGQLYGCDICQDACPFNAPRKRVYVNLQDWCDKTDDNFTTEYGHTAMLWQGADILRRNAKLQCMASVR